MIELAYEQAEVAGIMQLCEDEAGPYQVIQEPGADWHLQGKRTAQPHEYERGGDRQVVVALSPDDWRDAGQRRTLGAQCCNASWCGAPCPASIPKAPEPVINWLEQTVVGWNKQPTPFVWNGKRRRRRERARLRRLAGSGAEVAYGKLIAN